MRKPRMTQYALLGVVLLGVLLCVPSAVALGEQTPRVGTLHIEGTGIERLVLQGSHDRKVFEPPEPNLVLPEDDYRLEQVTLQGGLSCDGSRVPAARGTVKIGPDAPARLKLGAPLRQIVKVERHGRVIDLNYELAGQAGESYLISQNQDSARPEFAVYQGDKKIGSGQFEFG